MKKNQRFWLLALALSLLLTCAACGKKTVSYAPGNIPTATQEQTTDTRKDDTAETGTTKADGKQDAAKTEDKTADDKKPDKQKSADDAKKAEEDGMNQIAEIFRITALNEEQHAKIWFKLLNDGIGFTEENLKNAAEGEHFEWAEMYADFAKTAEEEGFANIARLFSGVAAIDKSHEQRFLTLERSVREGGVFQSGEETTVWICRNCGHIAVGKTAPQVCPVCSHPQAYFQRRAENY